MQSGRLYSQRSNMVGSRLVHASYGQNGLNDLQSVRKQLVELTGPPKQLDRDGRLKRGVGRHNDMRDTLPAWSRRTNVRGGNILRRPATATGFRMGEPMRAHRSLTPSFELRSEALMLAGAAGPALRTAVSRQRDSLNAGIAVRPSHRTSDDARRGGTCTRDEAMYTNPLVGHGGENSSHVIEEAMQQARRDQQVLVQISGDASNAQQCDVIYQVQAALMRQSSSVALFSLHAERAQMTEELIATKTKLKDLAAVQKHLCAFDSVFGVVARR